MDTDSWIKQLNYIEIDSNEYIDSNNYLERLNSSKRSDIIIDSALTVEYVFDYLFKTRNIPDDFFEAYSDSFTKSTISLYEHYLKIQENGNLKSINGFVSNLKGKLFEIRAIEELTKDYSGFSLSIAEKANQPIWDIVGTSVDGSIELFQAKIGSADYLSKISNQFELNPDLKFILGNELFEKACENFPDLRTRFIKVDISNDVLTSELTDKLDVLIENFGIDIPDEIGDVIPYIGEIALGIKLLIELHTNKTELKYAGMELRNRIAMVKTIAILSKFGIKTAVYSLCGIIAAPTGPIGELVASLGGIAVTNRLLIELEPKFNKIVYNLLDINQDDIFYFKNKGSIDLIGYNLAQQTV